MECRYDNDGRFDKPVGNSTKCHGRSELIGAELEAYPRTKSVLEILGASIYDSFSTIELLCDASHRHHQALYGDLKSS